MINTFDKAHLKTSKNQVACHEQFIFGYEILKNLSHVIDIVQQIKTNTTGTLDHTNTANPDIIKYNKQMLELFITAASDINSIQGLDMTTTTFKSDAFTSTVRTFAEFLKFIE